MNKHIEISELFGIAVGIAVFCFFTAAVARGADEPDKTDYTRDSVVSFPDDDVDSVCLNDHIVLHVLRQIPDLPSEIDSMKLSLTYTDWSHLVMHFAWKCMKGYSRQQEWRREYEMQ